MIQPGAGAFINYYEQKDVRGNCVDLRGNAFFYVHAVHRKFRKPECIASTMTAPMSTKKTSAPDLMASIISSPRKTQDPYKSPKIGVLRVSDTRSVPVAGVFRKSLSHKAATKFLGFRCYCGTSIMPHFKAYLGRVVKI